MTTPDFALITQGSFLRLKAPDQQRLCDAAARAYPKIRVANLNASQRWQTVAQAKELYWGTPRVAKPNTQRPPQPKPPAEDFFADFPPYPMAGETCQCPICKEASHA